MYKFKGNFITNQEFYTLDFINKPNQNNFSSALQNKHILFRDYFEYKGTDKVYLFYSADDFANVYINGKFVSQGPAICFPFHQYYVKVDITKYVKSGTNSLAIHSYYQGLINRAYYSGDLRHMVIFDVVSNNNVLVFSSTKTKTINHSGFSISHIAGWINENDFNYNTDFVENYDSNSKEDKFYLEDFDDSKWNASFVRNNVDYKLYKLNIKPLVFEEILPIIKAKNEHIIYDLKQEIVGYPFIKIKGKQNQIIKIMCGEELNEDGSVRYDERCNCKYIEEWKLSGKEDTFIPLTYKAFRYIELSSDSSFEIISLKAIARHYPFKDRLHLKFEDKNINKVYKLCKNTIKYGVQDAFLDCPSREKGQYFGDGVYSSLTHVLLTGDTSLYKKFIVDAFSTSKIDKCLTAQGPCSYYQTIAEFPLFLVISLNYYLKMTGDKKFISKQKNNVKKLINSYYKKYFNKKDNLISVYDRWNVVDWPMQARDGYDFELPQHGKTNGYHNVMNAYYLWALKVCKNLYGETFNCDLASFEKSYKKAFFRNNEFKDSLTSEKSSLPSMVLGNLVCANLSKENKEKLILTIKKKRLSCSNLFITPLMFLFLKENGQDALIKELLLDKDGWLNMIKEGATTTFEAFSKEKKWNTSLLHTMFSFPILFLKD